MKPLGVKAYGSIPHLPESRLGPGDHSITPGEEKILTEKARVYDRIIVTEKLDGCCVAVARHQGEVIALSRAGYLASTSPYQHLQYFGVWVMENQDRFANLVEGERLCGEWMAMAHGTLYQDMDVPFIPFDLMVGTDRLPFDQMREMSKSCGLASAALLSDGPPISVETALKAVSWGGWHGALEEVEGAVWRCEHRGKYSFSAKFVRHSKVDGKYFTETTGLPPVMHWKPGG